jgi:hypothetical protein
MICTGTNKNGQPCKQHAVKGWNRCYAHGWENRFYIAFTWQEIAGDPCWKKKKAHWPILFRTWREASEHANSVHIFKNMEGRRKLTACVETCKATFPHPDLERIET